METKKFDIDVSISNMPDVALHSQAKVKGSARVHLMPFDITLNQILWTATEKHVKISSPGFTRIVNGKRKGFPSISFIDKKLGKLVKASIKKKVKIGLEALKARAQAEKKKKKEEAKKKERQKKLAELKAFFRLPKEQQDDILWDLWGKSHHKSKRTKIPERLKQSESQARYAADTQKFEVWKKNQIKQMRENKAGLEKIFRDGN